MESENEAVLINKIAGQLKKATIGIRLNPDINAPTHKKNFNGQSGRQIWPF